MSSREYKVYRYWSPSGKSYVGQTRNSLDFRAGKNGIIYKSCKKFYRAIQKYSWKWFENHREILEDNLTAEQADSKEKYYIGLYDSINNGYNILPGGEHNPSAALQKPVVCINCKTKETFRYDSGKKASLDLGIDNRNISSALTKGSRGNYRTTSGYVFVFAKEWDSLSEEEKSECYQITYRQHVKRRKQVMCLNTGKVYDSITDGANDTNSKTQGICKCCKNGDWAYSTSKDGIRYHWRYYKEGDKQCQLKLWLQGSKS